MMKLNEFFKIFKRKTFHLTLKDKLLNLKNTFPLKIKLFYFSLFVFKCELIEY